MPISDNLKMAGFMPSS